MRDMEKRVVQGSEQGWLSRSRKLEGERLDPHVYARGVNGLTIEEAVGRSHPRVMGILGQSGEEYSEFEVRMVRQAIRAALISQVSRANLYRIAGILVADRRDEGANVDTTLALAYVAALREAFLGEIAVGEAVQTDFGTGEVKYVSQDGKNAVVELASVGGEVWMGVDRIFRITTEEHGKGARDRAS